MPNFGPSEMKAALDQVSPTMCLAKWLQVTVHLHNGATHSCHHPDTHKVPIDGLAKNPSSLHNTEYKKLQRKEMLAGKRPKECDYCWRIEDSSKKSISDRITKSNEDWARPFLKEISEADPGRNVDPTYLEVNFGNLCNMKCSYCLPHISSGWMKELEEQGPYPTSTQIHSMAFVKGTDKMPWAGSDETNPYIKAFWTWWPEIYPKLQVLRVTGGEPLLNENVFRVLDYIGEHPKPNLQFCVNSNLMVPKPKLEKFIGRAEEILARGQIKSLSVFTSIDSWGEQAEYIRHGLRHEFFWNNVETVLTRLPEIEFVFMVTFNALSVTGFQPLLENFLKLRERFPNVRLDISYLRFPPHQSIKVLTSDYLPKVLALVEYMESHAAEKTGKKTDFYDYEIEKMRRLYQWMLIPDTETSLVSQLRKDFYLFFSEHDRRRKTDFLKTFAEMKNFWSLCRELAEKSEAHAHGV